MQSLSGKTVLITGAGCGIGRLMAREAAAEGANLALIAFSRSMGNETGHVMAIFVMTVAAAEAAVGLALVLAIFRHRGTVDVDQMRSLKG